MKTSTRKFFFKYIKLINLYPPFLGAGIRVKEAHPEGNAFRVELKLSWYNRNVYGTHYGGSLYSMCDPFYVFAAYSFFGDDYILWDKSASIEYIKPAKGRVSAWFEIPKHQLIEMKKEVDDLGKQTYSFEADIKNEKNVTVAKVVKEIYIRKK